MGVRVAFRMIESNLRDHRREGSYQVRANVRVGVLVDSQASRGVGAVNQTNPVLETLLLNQRLNVGRNLPQLDRAARSNQDLLFHGEMIGLFRGIFQPFLR